MTLPKFFKESYSYKLFYNNSAKQQLKTTHTHCATKIVVKSRMPTRWDHKYRTAGWVLEPTDIDPKSGKTVLDVLKEKHPPPGKLNPDAFLHCYPLPHLVDI